MLTFGCFHSIFICCLRFRNRYEAVAVAAGAETVTTIEYNKLTYDHPKMFTATPAEIDPPGAGFDFAFSISSFDHDGT